MTYIPLPQREEGKKQRVLTSDERVIQLLKSMESLLRKIEYHQMLVTDTDLKETNL